MNGISIDRADFAAIAQWVKPNAHVLDLGCGDGALFNYLKRERAITGYGVEIDDNNVLACARNGVNVIQRNLERGLREFDDQSFDCVILSQTLQAMRHGDRQVFVGNDQRLRHLGVGLFRAREGLDDRREIGAGIGEKVVGAVIGERAQERLSGDRGAVFHVGALRLGSHEFGPLCADDGRS